MKRRAFVSMLLGAAGAPLVPWRGIVEPRIFLPPAAPGLEALVEHYARSWMRTVANVNRVIGDFQAYDSVLQDLTANHVSIDPRTGQFSLGYISGTVLTVR